MAPPFLCPYIVVLPDTWKTQVSAIYGNYLNLNIF